MAVLFERRVANSLVSALFGAINGNAIARGISFLKDSMGESLFQPNINIIDDPLILRGHGSRPWDGEGVVTRRHNIIENGKLTSWLLNCATKCSARPLIITQVIIQWALPAMKSKTESADAQ